ncbi:MAG: hypothetical protein JWP57_4061, partial [Spirosoma sp.]|nr:hypothetical protein [Spirosoma sp.]
NNKMMQNRKKSERVILAFSVMVNLEQADFFGEVLSYIVLSKALTSPLPLINSQAIKVLY